MLGIIAAMDMELDGLLARMENPQEKVISGRRFLSGAICGKPVVAAVCGIGKVNAAVCAQAMIMAYAPAAVINTGVGGALNKTLRVCDAVVAEYAVQHDVDTTALGDLVGFVSTVNTVRFETDPYLSAGLKDALEAVGVRAMLGGIATGDRFVSAREEKERIVSLFGCDACEMEGAAIAQVCKLNGVPCAILRSISDGADEEAGLSYQVFAAKAAETSVKAILEFLKK